jgi:hypothetical protein
MLNETTQPKGKRIIFRAATDEQLEAWKRGEIELWRMDLMENGEWVTRSMYSRTEIEHTDWEAAA